METSEISRQDEAIEIMLPTRFAYLEAHELKKGVFALLQAGQVRLSFNFASCEFIDSSGLGVLVTIYKRCLELKGSMTLSSLVNRQVKDVFHLTKLDRIFTII